MSEKAIADFFGDFEADDDMFEPLDIYALKWNILRHAVKHDPLIGKVMDEFKLRVMAYRPLCPSVFELRRIDKMIDFCTLADFDHQGYLNRLYVETYDALKVNNQGKDTTDLRYRIRYVAHKARSAQADVPITQPDLM